MYDFQLWRPLVFIGFMATLLSSHELTLHLLFFVQMKRTPYNPLEPLTFCGRLLLLSGDGSTQALSVSVVFQCEAV